MRVFSACQGLMMPTGCYRVTHKRCREVLKQELGFCPKGKPGTREEGDPKGLRKGGEPEILAWLGVTSIERFKEQGFTVLTFAHEVGE